jgi:seryl-tRNA synthetase
MLQVQAISNHKEAFAKALKKRGVDATTVLNQVLEVDENRRATQTKLDEILAESNSLSKEIGMLFKSGKIPEATLLKEKTITLKEASKTLDEQLKNVSEELQNLLYTIPNIPNELVPAGQDENDNEETFREGDIPVLAEGSLPHWELAKKIRYN